MPLDDLIFILVEACNGWVNLFFVTWRIDGNKKANGILVVVFFINIFLITLIHQSSFKQDNFIFHKFVVVTWIVPNLNTFSPFPNKKV
jgi:hypothetical protein